MTLALASVAALSIGYPRGAPTAAPEMRLEIVTPPGADVSGFAISPDGRTLVFQAAVDGKNQLWLRPLDSETARPLAGTEGGTFPFWSPDNQSVAFFAGGQLRRIDVASGFVQNLAEAPLNTRGGAWNAAGTILFTRSSTEPLFRVPASGGKAVAATEVIAPHLGHRYPQFLPDGQHFLFFAFGPPDSQGVYAGSLDSMKATRLLDAESAPIFAPPNYVLFARGCGAGAADRPRHRCRQSAIPAGCAAGRDSAGRRWGASRCRPRGRTHRLPRKRRRSPNAMGGSAGRQIAVLGGPDSGEPAAIRLSPDGRMVAVYRMVNGNSDIWLFETARDVRQRLTTNPAREFEPVWAPDGSRIIFGSTRQGVVDLYERSVGSTATETLVWESSESKNALDWSPDGKWILFAVQSARTARDLWALPSRREEADRRVVHRRQRTVRAIFSRQPLGCLSVERERTGRNLHSTLSRTRRQDANLDRRRHVSQVAA